MVVTGDDRAVARLREAVSPHTAERLQVLDTGGRAAGVDEQALCDAVQQALAAHRRATCADVLARFEQAEGRQDVAVVDEVDDVDLTGGVAAVLRWSDPSTPHDSARSMPGHGEHSGH